jgi:rod shape determining protein RodA
VGVSAYLLFHVFVNVAMTIGLAPVTGLPLPGLSFGGSVLMSTCFLVGVQMNISRNWARY